MEKSLLRRDALYMLRRVLNLVNYRVVEHCERVAYTVYRMLETAGGYTKRQMQEITTYAFLHDIGAFKTEKLHSLMNNRELLGYDQRQTERHCAYGYLFLARAMPFREWDDMVRYHHTPYYALAQSGCTCPRETQFLAVAERAELLLHMDRSDVLEQNLKDYEDRVFSADAVRVFLETRKKFSLREAVHAGECGVWLTQLLEGFSLTVAQMLGLLVTIAYMVDFRSRYTVTHTFTTVSVSVGLARALGLDLPQMEKVYLGALLHDMGKIVTPLNILEKPGKLTAYEYHVMQDHVTATRKLLEGVIDQEIVEIAARHHEKLDGSGYPQGLDGQDLTELQRIVAVADIISALLGRRSYKDAMQLERVAKILREEAESKLCPHCIETFIAHAPEILEQMERDVQTPMQQYQEMLEDYPKYCADLQALLNRREESA